MEVTCKELIKAFEELNQLLQMMHEHSSLNFLPLSKKIRSYYDGLQKLSEPGSEDVSGSKIAFLNKIITELQFHDIIRQKLEHIEQIHFGLIEELVVKNSQGHVQESKYLRVLPAIIRLNVAQLELVNEEFDKAVIVIKKNLVEIEDSLKKASIETADSFKHASTFLFVSKKIIEDLKYLNFYLSQSMIRNEESFIPDHIEKFYTMESERSIFHQVFNNTGNIQMSGQRSDDDNSGTVEFF